MSSQNNIIYLDNIKHYREQIAEFQNKFDELNKFVKSDIFNQCPDIIQSMTIKQMSHYENEMDEGWKLLENCIISLNK